MEVSFTVGFACHLNVFTQDLLLILSGLQTRFVLGVFFFFLQYEFLSLLKQPQNVVLHVIPENVKSVIFLLQ